jgi:hypothetical protein
MTPRRLLAPDAEPEPALSPTDLNLERPALDHVVAFLTQESRCTWG